jgi:hypothetical protein
MCVCCVSGRHRTRRSVPASVPSIVPRCSARRLCGQTMRGDTMCDIPCAGLLCPESVWTSNAWRYNVGTYDLWAFHVHQIFCSEIVGTYNVCTYNMWAYHVREMFCPEIAWTYIVWRYNVWTYNVRGYHVQEMFCPEIVRTYNGIDWSQNGAVTQGGYSTCIIVEEECGPFFHNSNNIITCSRSGTKCVSRLPFFQTPLIHNTLHFFFGFVLSTSPLLISTCAVLYC